MAWVNIARIASGLCMMCRLFIFQGRFDMSDAKRPVGYEKPTIRRHAVVMTMAPAGCKMGHGLFPFVTKKKENQTYTPDNSVYRRV